MRRKVFKKRSLAKLNFTVGPDLDFAVRLYNLTQDTKKVLPTLQLFVCVQRGI